MLHLSAGLTAYILIVTGALGAVLGSFVCCAAGRAAAGESFVKGRSHCDACGHVLTARELIPVVSWLLQKGRCRWCGAKISPRCPLTECLCAACFIGIVLRYDVSAITARNLILTVILLAVALVDYDTGFIPDKLLIGIFADWLVFVPLAGVGALWPAVREGVIGALAASVPLLILSLVMDRVLGRESMGGGDIKLFFVCGLFFNWREVLFFLIVSCILGLLFAALSGKTVGDPENPKAFPFGPAIAAGAYVSLLAAEWASNAYFSLF